jgi:hypothetical protein
MTAKEPAFADSSATHTSQPEGWPVCSMTGNAEGLGIKLAARGFGYTQQAGDEQSEGGWLRDRGWRNGCAESRRVAKGLEDQAAASGGEVCGLGNFRAAGF